MEEIKLAKEESEPDSEQIGIVKARVKRAVEGVRTSQKELDKSKANLTDLIADQDSDADILTDETLEMLRKVIEKQTDGLQDRLELIAIRLENAGKTIKDLTSSPTKFQEDRRNAPETLKMSSAEKDWESYSNWRKGIDRYVSDCYKSDTNATKKLQCVRPAMTSYMDQKWKDVVQRKLDKATSVKQLDNIMSEAMAVIWQNTENENSCSNLNKIKKQILNTSRK